MLLRDLNGCLATIPNFGHQAQWKGKFCKSYLPGVNFLRNCVAGKKNRSAFFFIFTLFLFLASCASTEVEVVRPSSEVFSNKQYLFEIKHPVPVTIHSEEGPGFATFIFLHNDEAGNWIETISIRIQFRETEKDKFYSDVFTPGYETKFLAGCQCAVAESGIVNISGIPARHYSISKKNGEISGFQRHITYKDRIYIIELTGPSSDQLRIKSQFESLIQNFRFLEEVSGENNKKSKDSNFRTQKDLKEKKEIKKEIKDSTEVKKASSTKPQGKEPLK